MVSQTQEFSICLLLDEPATRQIEDIRAKLPSSSYRDDPPHLTLLRGITSKEIVSAEELSQNLQKILTIKPGTLHVRITGLQDVSNQFYTKTTVLQIAAFDELTRYREKITDQLRLNRFQVEQKEVEHYTPHITVRLGVTINDSLRTSTEKLFVDHDLTFTSYALFRLVLRDGNRHMHILKLDS